MAKLKVQGNASGTGVVTLTAPNTNTDRTITLPDETVSLTGAPAGLDDVSGVARATSGLLFNGDTAAANALDDYEEGTFDADIKDDTGVVMASTSGFYVKVGKLVKCRIQIYINSVTASTFTGAPYITIPFVPYASTSAGFYPQYNNGLATINSGYISGGIGNLYLTTNRDEPYGSIATGGSYGGSVRLYGEFSYIAN